MMTFTKYPEGSLRELWSITFPLMLSALSVASMTFVDRLLLANYSSAALNAAANSMTLGWTFIFGWMVLAGISEVFVAQNNGAKNYAKLGEPVWQMIWLSLSSCLFFLPLALNVNELFFVGPERSLEREYLQWIFLFAPTFPLYCALCGFFIGQGKTRLVTITALAANLMNACFDYGLIFGLGQWLPSFGIGGAAIATGCSSLFQTLILLVVFLNKTNRQLYGTNQWQLNRVATITCLRIGLPGAIFAFAEMSGWVAYYTMMTKLSERHLTIASISQSLIILFYFFVESVSKGVSTIAGNLIGAEKPFLVTKVIISGARLHFIFFICLLCLTFFYTDQILFYFMPQATNAELASIKPSLFYSLLTVACYLFFEGIRLLFGGVLTAAGDTLFLLIGGSLSTWVFMVLPVYQLVYLQNGSIERAATIGALYSLLAGILYFYRFYGGYWRSLSLVKK